MASKHLFAFIVIVALCQLMAYVLARPETESPTAQQTIENMLKDFKDNLDGVIKNLQNDTLVKDLTAQLESVATSIKTEAQNLQEKIAQSAKN